MAARCEFATRKDAEEGLRELAEMGDLLGKPSPSYCIREAATAEDAMLQVTGFRFRSRSA